jgi:hypothetical protein
MAAQSLTELVATLTPQEEAAVREFIAYLKRHESPFLGAAEEFIAQHPDLLQRLAQ